MKVVILIPLLLMNLSIVYIIKANMLMEYFQNIGKAYHSIFPVQFQY